MTLAEDKQLILSLIENAVSDRARKTKVCEMLGVPMRTTQRWEKSVEDKRKYRLFEPKNKLTKKEQEDVINVCCEERFVDKSPNEIVPILAEEGIYIASSSTMYRLLKAEKMINHREDTQSKKKNNKVEELVATGPNQVWSWDITYLRTCIKGVFFYLYLFLDVWSRKIVLWDIFEEQTSENARDLMTRLNLSGKSDLKDIHLHSDNGSPMKGATFLATLQWLGIIPSFSRPSCSNDNPYSESLFKTIKYKINFPKSFESIEDAKNWFTGFVEWYNNEHRHSGINYVTPNQRHTGEDVNILEIRKQTYELAKKRNPARWIQNKIRNWDWKEVEVLNPNLQIERNQKRRQVA